MIFFGGEVKFRAIKIAIDPSSAELIAAKLGLSWCFCVRFGG